MKVSPDGKYRNEVHYIMRSFFLYIYLIVAAIPTEPGTWSRHLGHELLFDKVAT